MGTSLSGLTPATTFDGLLKTSDNDALDATLKTIGTGDGTDSVLQLSDSALQIGGTFNVDGGIATFKGVGSSYLTSSFIIKNSADAEIFRVRDDGQIYATYISAQSVNASSYALYGADYAPNIRVNIKGSGATSATTSLLVQNSNGADLLQTLDNGSVGVGGPANASYRVSLPSGVTRVRDLLFGQTGGAAINNTSLLTMKWNGSTGIGISGNGAIDATARLHLKGSGNDNTTTSLLVQNSDATELLKINDDGEVFFGDVGKDTKISLRRSSAGSIMGSIEAIGNGFYLSGYQGNSNILFGRSSTEGITINNGQTRLAASLGVKGLGATSATTALLVQNSAGAQLIKARDDSQIQLGQSSNFTIDGVTTYNRYGLVVGSTSPESNTRLFVKGSGNDAATTALLVQNSDGTDTFKVLDDGNVQVAEYIYPADGTTNSRFRVSNSAGTYMYYSTGNLKLNPNLVYTSTTYGTVFSVSNSTGDFSLNGATGAKMAIKGNGATSATTALLVENSAGTDLLKVEDGGDVKIDNGVAADLKVKISPTDVKYIELDRQGRQVRFYSGATGNAGIFMVQDDKFSIGTNNTSLILLDENSNVRIGSGITAANTSAKLEVDSTTQGFLPPRMTDAERDAIATPAAGLMIYDTSNNQMNYWNGSTWIAF